MKRISTSTRLRFLSSMRNSYSIEIRVRSLNIHRVFSTLLVDAADTRWSVDRRSNVRNWAFDVPVALRAIITPADNVLHRWDGFRGHHPRRGNSRRRERGGVRLDQGGVRSVSRIRRRWVFFSACPGPSFMRSLFHREADYTVVT